MEDGSDITHPAINPPPRACVRNNAIPYVAAWEYDALRKNLLESHFLREAEVSKGRVDLLIIHSCTLFRINNDGIYDGEGIDW